MAYIGYNPSQLAIAPFATKYFTGDGATTTFTLDQSVPGANEANVEVFVENVQQNPVDAYTIGGALNNQLIFSEAPVTGGAIYVIHKGEATYNLQPATGSVTANTLDPVLRNFTVDKFTGNGSTKTFTLTDTPYSPNSVLVVVDGITQTSGTNYNVTGNTLTFDVAPTASPDNGSNVTVVHLGFSSGNKAVMDASITPVKLSTGGPSWDTSSNLTVNGRFAIGSSAAGTSSPLEVFSTGTSTSFRGNIVSILRSNGSGRAVTTRLSDSVANSTDWSMVGSTARFSLNGVDAIQYNASGQVSVGTVTSIAPSTLLSVFGTSSDHGMYSQTRATTGGTPVGVGQEMYLRFVDSAGTPFVAGSIYAEARNGGASGVVPAGQGGGALELRAWTTGSLSNRIRLEQNGTVNFPYGQIQFPAVQNASSDPNTLDDYEEGTWTPFFTSDGGTTGTTNVTTRWGRYQKIGRQVFVTFGWTGSLSGYTGTLYVGGTPFIAIEDTTYQFGGGLEVSSTTATAMDGVNYMFFAFSTALYPRFTTGQQIGYLFANASQINGLTSFKGSMTYFTPN
jgi:hypothetical protein